MKEKWRLSLQRELGPEGFGDVLRHAEAEGVFGQWKRLWDPGGHAEFYLDCAIDVLCGDWHHPYAPAFLSYAQQIADRAYSETERWLPTGDWGRSLPGTIRGSLLRAKALADAIVANSDPDASLLIEAANGILKESREARGPKWWTELEQSQFLSALQLLLIAGDIAVAKDALKGRKSFRATHYYHDWLKTFVLALPDDGGLVDTAAHAHFDAFFDKVRDPDWVSPKDRDSGYNIVESRPMLRIQLAMLKQRYVVGAPIAGHWSDVIDLIAR